jgi:tRNA(fMet)-specific endonuclease VapC
VKIDGILDTTIVIDLLNSNAFAVAWYQGLGRQQISITPVVWMEVVQGARNKTERAQILRFLRQFSIEHSIYDDNNWAMIQFAQFNLSHGIEIMDIMIASVAVRLNVPLYTLNLKHYAPLPNVDERRPY